MRGLTSFATKKPPIQSGLIKGNIDTSREESLYINTTWRQSKVALSYLAESSLVFVTLSHIFPVETNT